MIQCDPVRATTRSGGHGTRTRNRFPGTSFPVRPLTNSLTLREIITNDRCAPRFRLEMGEKLRSRYTQVLHPLVQHLGARDQLQEFLVGFEFPQLLGQLFHGIDMMH